MVRKYKILHFEDDKFLRNMYEVKFLKYGFEYVGYDTPTTDPVSVVSKEKPDLIIMDIIMPTMSGFDATKRLKDYEGTKNIPVVGLCNLGQREDIEKAKDLGMTDYLVSGQTTPQMLVNRIREILGLSIPTKMPFAEIDVSKKEERNSNLDGRIKRPYWLMTLAFILLAMALLVTVYGIYLPQISLAVWGGLAFIILFPIANNLIKPYTVFSQNISCPNCGYHGHPVPYRSGWVSVFFLIFGVIFGSFLIRLGGPDFKCPRCNNVEDLVRSRQEE